MARETLTRRRTTAVELPRSTSAIIDGKTVESGQMILVDDEDGEFVFRYLYLPDGSIGCWGGPKGHEQMRSFRPERCHIRKAPRKRPILSDERIAALTAQLERARLAKTAKEVK